MNRSWLYVPGDRPDRITKAFATEADAVIIDLEDAVKPAAKADARANAVAALAGDRRPQRWVRLNSGDDGRRDLDALVASPTRPDGVLLAKCDTPAWIAEVAAALPGVAVAPLVETAVALRDLHTIVAAPSVALCHLGEVDLLAELGGRLPGGQALIDHARIALVVASAAAGIGAPVGGVHLLVDDLQALAVTSSTLADLGFGGRAVIHPSHCAAVNAAFSPTAAEIEWARDVVALLDGAAGAVRDASGAMIDEAVARRARRMLNPRVSATPGVAETLGNTVKND
ncbi:MAG: CoA ester lyase [Actinomycetota bacterium]|nr:CoA ester lyase [Actinomycetota bacterium]